MTTDGGGNVVGNTTGSSGLTATSDKLNVPALLGPLASNGGTVQTFALQSGSPAIDIAACPNGLTTDARGVRRPQGTQCDAGSYELVVQPASAGCDEHAGQCERRELHRCGECCTLRQAVNLSNLTVGTGTNTITFAVNGTITLLAATGGMLNITHNAIIDATAGGRTVTIDGNKRCDCSAWTAA